MAATSAIGQIPPTKRWMLDLTLGLCLTVTLAAYAPRVPWLPFWAKFLCLPALSVILALLVRHLRRGPLARRFGDYSIRGRRAWLVGAGLGTGLLWVALPMPKPTLPARLADTHTAAVDTNPRPRNSLKRMWVRRVYHGTATACTFVSLSFGMLLTGLWLSGLSLHARPASGWLGGLGYFACCVCGWAVYLLLFWPGLMNADAFGQWEEMTNWRWIDHHPVLHTFGMWLVTRLWLSPAAVALAQIVVLAAVAGWALVRLRVWGLPRWLAAVICLTVALAPANGISAISLTKDAPFAAALLALTILVLESVQSRGEWLQRRWAWVGLGVTAALVMLLRLNGAMAAFGTLVALMVCYRDAWRRVAAATVLAVGLLAVVHGPFHRWLGVHATPERPGLNYVALHHIAAHVAAKTPLEPDEQALLDRLRPPPAIWPYLPSIANPIVFDGHFNWKAAGELSAQTVLLALKLDARAPSTALKHLAASNSYFWRITADGPGDQVWGICVGLTQDGRVWTMDPSCDASAFPPDSKLPDWQQPAASWLQDSYREPGLSWLFWRPALYLYLGLFASLLAVARARSRLWLLVLAPSLLNVASLVLTGCSQVYRYGHPLQFVVVIVAPFLALGVARVRAAEPTAIAGRRKTASARRAA